MKHRIFTTRQLKPRAPRINLIQVDEGAKLLGKVLHVVCDRDAAGRREDGQLHEVRPRHWFPIAPGRVWLEDFRHCDLHPTLAEQEPCNDVHSIHTWCKTFSNTVISTVSYEWFDRFEQKFPQDGITFGKQSVYLYTPGPCTILGPFVATIVSNFSTNHVYQKLASNYVK